MLGEGMEEERGDERNEEEEEEDEEEEKDENEEEEEDGRLSFWKSPCTCAPTRTFFTTHTYSPPCSESFWVMKAKWRPPGWVGGLGGCGCHLGELKLLWSGFG